MSTLDNLPAVLFVELDMSRSLTPPKRAKFMLMRITHGPAEKIILRTIPEMFGHKNVLEWFEIEAAEASLSGCIIEHQRGGFLTSNNDAKKITIGGRSLKFGTADHALAQKLLQEALPDYQVVINPA